MNPPAITVPTAMPHRLCECHDCGYFHALPPLPRYTVAKCTRCRAVLARGRSDPLQRPLALSITSLLLLLLALALPFMNVSLGGRAIESYFTTGAVALEPFGLWELTLVVLGTTVAAPALRLGGLVAVLIGLRVHAPPRRLYMVFRVAMMLRQWAMVEVYMLGIFVAYSKLTDLVHVAVGPAVYALGALMLMMAATDASLDPEAVWTALERRDLVANPPAMRVHDHARGLGAAMDGLNPGSNVSCLTCGLITHVSAAGRVGDGCARCGTPLHHRKPDSLRRAWALLIAAAVLYIPANVFPVLTLISIGRGTPSTIIGGVIQLAGAHLWLLAILVFVASITVPVLKILGLTIMLLSVHWRLVRRLRDRTVLYRVVELVGRWSMIDVFMISILTGLVRLGFIANVEPGGGAVAFAGVVILTMLAAGCFDPRLMWDAAGRPSGSPTHE
jgi:paraquat-inducible protein A